MPALAYRLIWTTYGTWLPGDRRGWVKKKALGIQRSDKERECASRERMSETEVHLSPDQRAAIEKTVREHCEIRRWHLHAVQAS